MYINFVDCISSFFVFLIGIKGNSKFSVHAFHKCSARIAANAVF